MRYVVRRTAVGESRSKVFGDWPKKASVMIVFATLANDNC